MYHCRLNRLICFLAFTVCATVCATIFAQPPHFDPRSFLDRMDRNKNGILDPDEVDERAAGFLRRMKPDISLERGISIDKVAKMMQKSREDRDRGREHDRDRDRDRSDRNNEQNAPQLEALVAGFGEEELDLSPVINFGSTPENYVVVEQSDRDKANYVMEKYDRNSDGQLSKEERERTRWSDNPLQYDTNRDGRLSYGELTKRYAYQRQRDVVQRDSSSSDARERDRGDRGNRGWRSRGGDEEAAVVEIITGDGQVRYLEPEERLPDGLPEWFGEKDLDGDGQLTMAEFIAELTPEEVAKFTSQDLDNNGILIAAELGVKPSDHEHPKESSRSDYSESRGQVVETPTSSDESTSRSISRSTTIKSSKKSIKRSTAKSSSASNSEQPAETAADVDEKYQKYAAGRVKQYDANRDGVLSIEECKAGKPGLVEADADKNGKITTEEVARFYQRLYKR